MNPVAEALLVGLAIVTIVPFTIGVIWLGLKIIFGFFWTTHEDNRINAFYMIRDIKRDIAQEKMEQEYERGIPE